MSVRYQKRVNLGKGVGLNVSGSGISTSLRTKYGSISPRGFSFRTGIPGLSFRSISGKGKNAGAAIAVLLFIGAVVLGALFVWNLALLAAWIIRESVNVCRRYYMRKRMSHGANVDLRAEGFGTGVSAPLRHGELATKEVE